MHRMIIALALFLSLPAFGQEGTNQTAEAPTEKVRVRKGDTFVETPAGTRVEVTEKIVMPEEEPDLTENSPLLGRPAVSYKDVCGFAADLEHFSGRQQRKLAREFPECVRAQADFVRAEATYLDANWRGSNTKLALEKDRDMMSDGNLSATGEAANLSAIYQGDSALYGYGRRRVGGLSYLDSEVGAIRDRLARGRESIVSQYHGSVRPDTRPDTAPEPPPKPPLSAEEVDDLIDAELKADELTDPDVDVKVKVKVDE